MLTFNYSSFQRNSLYSGWISRHYNIGIINCNEESFYYQDYNLFEMFPDEKS